MAGGLGVVLDPPPGDMPRHAWLFGEDQGRYLIETAEPGRVLAAAHAAAVHGARDRHGRRGRVDTPRRRCHIG